MDAIATAFTKLMGIKFPLIAAPMFLVSNEDIVVGASEAGGIGAFPALNYRPIEKYREALSAIKKRTTKPVCVNVIVNKINVRQGEDLKWALNAGVEMFITSLGNPKTVIQEAQRNGAKVFCDVTNLEHAQKVQDLGADGVIAVSSGAGGHAGPVTPFVLLPWLRSELKICVISAGGISHGSGMAAALALGADGVSVGTRFIASREATVDAAYKQAVVDSTPEDIVLTTRLSGTPATVINTEYVQKIGLDLPLALKILKDNKYSKKYVVPLIHLLGMRSLENAANKPTWKSVWCAGQSVGMIDEILSVPEIFKKFLGEYEGAKGRLP